MKKVVRVTNLSLDSLPLVRNEITCSHIREIRNHMFSLSNYHILNG